MPTASYSLSMEVVQKIERLSQEKRLPKSRIVDSALRKGLSIKDTVIPSPPEAPESIEQNKPYPEHTDPDLWEESEGEGEDFDAD